jgi:hypothetical protein
MTGATHRQAIVDGGAGFIGSPGKGLRIERDFDCLADLIGGEGVHVPGRPGESGCTATVTRVIEHVPGRQPEVRWRKT